MKTKFLGALLCLFMSYSYAQIGIGTTNPQEKLHVAGANSTIRIEGLNSTNNALNPGGNRLIPVSVTANGDLQLSQKTLKSVVYLSQTGVRNNTANPLKISTTWFTPNTNSADIKPLTSFIVSKSGLHEVLFNITITLLESQDNSIPITILLRDGRPRVVSVRVYIDGNLVTESSQNYSSSKSSPLSGLVTVNGSKVLNLTAGSHTYRVEGVVNGGTYPTQAFFVDIQDANDKNVFQIIQY